jgi:PPOX class probable F420-dependent enzyme
MSARARLAVMTDDVFPDPSTPFGQRVQRRLRDEQVIWLTTVGADGTPQPNPVWFVVDGRIAVVYNRSDARRLGHIRRNPRVALHLDGDGRGGDVIVLTGTAEIAADQPLAHEFPPYLAKYRQAAERVSGKVDEFSADYSVALRITIDRVRGF